jgi:hypothetical protein
MFKYDLIMLKAILEEKIIVFIVTASVLFLGLYFYNQVIRTDYQNSNDTQIRIAVVKTLGGPLIPIIAQCCTSRNLSEGIYARRSDIPGGFCFNSDCDIVYNKKLYNEKQFTIKK